MIGRTDTPTLALALSSWERKLRERGLRGIIKEPPQDEHCGGFVYGAPVP